jgi:DNA-binding transcriptional regulator GbsR (MarR family)
VTVVEQLRLRFSQGMSRIAQFWGFPKAVGAAYAAVYLSPTPVTLDDLVTLVGVSKGALSIHLRTLERFGVVRRDGRPGDRKDYYSADTDFWGAVRRILREREQREFDRALSTVKECLALLDTASPRVEGAANLSFYRERLSAMQRFFDRLDGIVAAALALDDLRGTTIQKLLSKRRTRSRP